MKRKDVSVIMGDLISSRKYGSSEELFLKFNKSINSINKKQSQKILSPLTITLGDEFQGLTSSLIDSFKIARSLRLILLKQGIAIRFVIGDVQLSSPLNEKMAWNMMGHGFAEAREILNIKDDKSFYHFTLKESSKKFEPLFNVIGLAITDIENSWTDNQVDIVSFTLDNIDLKKEEIATKLGIARNTFYKTLKSARFNLYVELVKAIEKSMEGL